MQATKKINPLYVISKNGIDVQKASNLFDLFLKKSGLDQFVVILETIIAQLLSEVKTYAVFIEVKKVIDNLLNAVFAIIAL
jgi:hypothetical protein